MFWMRLKMVYKDDYRTIFLLHVNLHLIPRTPFLASTQTNLANFIMTTGRSALRASQVHFHDELLPSFPPTPLTRASRIHINRFRIPPPSTEPASRVHLDNEILPSFPPTALTRVSRIPIKYWERGIIPNLGTCFMDI
jgi:hypothetical protein